MSHVSGDLIPDRNDLVKLSLHGQRNSFLAKCLWTKFPVVVDELAVNILKTILLLLNLESAVNFTADFYRTGWKKQFKWLCFHRNLAAECLCGEENLYEPLLQSLFEVDSDCTG